MKEEVKRAIDMVFDSQLKDVEHIEIFWKKGGTNTSINDNLIRYWRTNTIFTIQAKSRDITINISDTVKIVVKKKENK